MASVNVTLNNNPVTLASKNTTHAAILAQTTPKASGVTRINIPALNQKFSAGENITLSGNEIITTSLY
jgi:sulfur carrier protein ThiS